MLNENIENIIKDKMGNKFPSDLIFEITNEEVSFYNSDTPEKNSVFFNDKEVEESDINRIIDIITKYHIE